MERLERTGVLEAQDIHVSIVLTHQCATHGWFRLVETGVFDKTMGISEVDAIGGGKTTVRPYSKPGPVIVTIP